MPPVVVIGSGPAGIAAAQGLLRAGVAVTLLDVGRDLPAAARDWREQLAALEPDAWDRAELARYNQTSLADRDGVPLKTVFGSDYPYRAQDDVRKADVSLFGSHALGGLSNAWGASMLPLSARDVRDWPLSRADFDPHYAAVLEWLPHAQSRDDLASDYPLHAEQSQALALSAQGAALLGDLQAGRAALQADAIRFGRARLAVANCRYCGQCLHGCPYDVIYSSRHTLQTLLAHPRFTYQGQTEVLSISEDATGVSLQTQRGGVRETLVAERVYVGSGVLNTALLMLPLLGERRLQIRDSAYYVVPFLRRQRTPGAGNAPGNTLAQLFMEVDVPDVSPHNVHLQWYGYNDFYAQELANKLGPFYRLVPQSLAALLLERLWTVQGFLHSDDSPAIELTLDSQMQNPTLAAVPTDRAERLFAATLQKLGQHTATLGGRPLGLALRRGPVGSSFHSGASLPMARSPAGLQSDTAGRPAGLQRVHVVDASVLPGIAPSTITLTVMANAHRIASMHRDYA